MLRVKVLTSTLAAFIAVAMIGAAAVAATTMQVGASGKTYASSAIQCATNASGALVPVVEVGLVQPKSSTSAAVSLNGATVATVTATNPSAKVWLINGANTVVIAISKKTADSYSFVVQPGMCSTAGNTFSADGTLEYGASGKSYATVTPGCAWNAATGRAQPYVHLFDNGTWLLNVSVNGVPLTQLSTLKTHTPVFLSAGENVISAANGSLSTDYYVRAGGDGTCTLP